MPQVTSHDVRSSNRTTEPATPYNHHLLDARLADLTAAFQTSSDFQSNNQDAISRTGSRLASSVEVKAIEEKVKDFASSSQVLMSALDEVRKIHPVIDVVVLAFKAVVTLELKRRDNDQKVLVLQVKMQDMMEIFVQLRVIAPHQTEPDRGFTVAESLSKLCSRIAEDIWSCANLCDSYSKKRFLVKLLKSPIYEGRLAGFIETFVERRTELHTVVGMFTAHKIHSTFSLLEDNQDVLKAINDSIQVIFERLRTQTPIEKQIWKMIESKGGLEKCIQDDSVLIELVKFDLYGPAPSEDPIVTSNPAGLSTDYTGYPAFSSPGAALGLNPTPPTYQPPVLQYRPSTVSQGPAAPISTPAETYYRPGSESIGQMYTAYPSAIYGTYTQPSPYGTNIQPSPVYTVHNSRSRSRSRRSSYSKRSVYFERPIIPDGPSTFTYTTRPSTHSQSWSGYPDTRQQEAQRSSAAARRTMTTQYDGEEDSYGRYDYGRRPLDDPESKRNQGDLPEPAAHIVNDLKEELQVDIDDDLKKNMEVFKRKLDVQQQLLLQIEDTVVRQGDRVVSVIREGPHYRIHDLELRAIWKEMGWKLGVPVQEFVHTLHDYYVAQNTDSTVLDDHFRIPPSPGSTAEDQILALRTAFSAAKQRTAERWALKHINIKNIVPLMEVFDGDASGFVSVWEANQVASLRPKDWSFLQWLAYWAAGRHFTIWQYRQKIGAIILQMHKSLDDLLPTNRDIVNHYLLSLWTVDQVLFQIIPCIEPPDGILTEKIADYINTEESIMEQKLAALNYEIDGPDTLGLIISNSQIERNLLPLIYLLLKHHLKVIRAGTHSVFDHEEFSASEETVYQIFDAINARVDTLYWLFGSNTVEPSFLWESRLENFAFGMYSAVFRGNDPYYPTVIDYGISKGIVEQFDGINSDISLKHPSPEIVEPTDPSSLPFKLKDCITGVEGFWTGFLYDTEKNRTIHGMIEFNVYTWNFSDESFAAKGSYSQGTLFMNGTIKIHGQQGMLDAHLLTRPDYRKDQKYELFLRGTLEIVRDFAKGSSARSLPPQYILSGDWGYPFNQTQPRGTFYFSQTPVWVHQFRLFKVPQTSALLVRGERSPPRRAWLRWKFACQAVLYQVHSEKGFLHTEAVRDMLFHLRRGVQLARYQYLLSDNQPMSARDQEEVNRLLVISAPWTARLYRSVARCQFPSGWGALHFSYWCSMCNGVILGNRYYCFTCAKGTYPAGDELHCEFCSTCRHEHDRARRGHSFIKMKTFNHNRDICPLLERIKRLQYRSAGQPVIVTPSSRADSERTNSPVALGGDINEIRNKVHSDGDSVKAIWDLRSPKPSDAISKRVRFSLSAFRPSSSAPSNTVEHDVPSQSKFRRHRRASSPSSTSGSVLSRMLYGSRPAVRSAVPNSTNSIAAESELSGTGEKRLSMDVDYESKPHRNLLQHRCVSCNRGIDLGSEIYWSCIICSNPEANTHVVVCSECEMRDRGLYVPKATTDTSNSIQSETESRLRNLDGHGDAVGIIDSASGGGMNTTEHQHRDHKHHDTAHDLENFNDYASHKLDHPIIRVLGSLFVAPPQLPRYHSPPLPPPVVIMRAPSSRSSSPPLIEVPYRRSSDYVGSTRYGSFGGRDTPSTSRRRIVLDFVKGMFGSSSGEKSSPTLASTATSDQDWQSVPRSGLEDSRFDYHIL